MRPNFPPRTVYTLAHFARGQAKQKVWCGGDLLSFVHSYSRQRTLLTLEQSVSVYPELIYLAYQHLSYTSYSP